MIELEAPTYTLSIEAMALAEVDPRDVKNLYELEGYKFDKRYVADNQGKVYRIRTASANKLYVAEMRPYINRDHYVEFVLTDKTGKKQHIQGQRIVAGLYLKNPKKLSDVNHKDGDRQNNKVENLEWMSHLDNVRHSFQELRGNPNRINYSTRK